MAIEDIQLQEQKALRSELKHLKNCQLRYFILSITVTGIILGIGSKLQGNIGNSVFLASLVVVVPCWIIFFDKAKTITRIVGYYRVLEKILIDGENYQYIGWENALAKFRDFQNNGELKKLDQTQKRNSNERAINILRLNTAHRYWVINYHTFFFLSMLSLIASIFNFSLLSISIAFIPGAAVCFASVYTLRMLIDLIGGKNSYSSNQRYWEHILGHGIKK